MNGHCPFCASNNLSVKCSDTVGNTLFNYYRCDSCGKLFSQEFKITYLGTYDEYGREIK